MDSIDVRNNPELERLADEIRTTRRSRVLRRGSQDLAIVMPIEDHTISEAKDDPQGVWTSYDPELVRIALAATMGSWSDLNTDKMISDLYRAREKGSRTIDVKPGLSPRRRPSSASM